MPPPDLRATRIVWTGSADTGRGLVAALARAGAQVSVCPLIRTVPTPPADAAAVIDRLGATDWLIFTSAKGVAGLPASVDLASCSARIGVVGPATRDAVVRRGGRVAAMPVRHDAAALAASVAAESERGAQALFVRGDRALSTIEGALSSAGMSVRVITVYETTAAPPEALARALAGIMAADAVVMGSPFGVHVLAAAVHPARIADINPGLVWLCLGNATRAALRGEGIDAACPAVVDPDAMVTLAAARLGGLPKRP